MKIFSPARIFESNPRLPDIAALFALLVLAFLFYFPSAGPLESRYMYYSDAVERSLSICNPDYDNSFQRNKWETFSPLATLIMNISMRFLHERPETAVMTAHMGTIVLSAVALYLLCRLFMSAIAAFSTTALIFCGRTLLPLAYGLGQSNIHILLPASLGAVFFASSALAPGKNPRRKLHILAASACLAAIYCLGNHETVYAAASAFIAATALSAAWLARSIRNKRPASGPPRAFYSLAATSAVMGVLLMAASRSAIPQRQEPAPLLKMLAYHTFLQPTISDATSESKTRSKDRLRVLQGSFVSGEYLTEYGRHHEHTFLRPGPGFNGIIPLFIPPGFIFGFAFLLKETRRSRLDKENSLSLVRWRWFLFFILTLLAFFVLTAATSMDPKPTRYTFSVFAVLVAGVWGYEYAPRVLAGMIARLLGGSGIRLERALKTVSSILLLVFLGAHIHKNYLDLKTYEQEYAHQIPSAYFNPLIDMAYEAAEGKDAAILFYTGDRPNKFNSHVSLGIKQSCGVPPNIRFVRNRKEVESLPGSVRVIPIDARIGIPDSLYYLPRSKWPDRH